MKIEAYYQHLNRLPVAPADATDPEERSFYTINYEDGFYTDSLVNEGMGRYYGIKFTLEKYFTKNYYLLITNSLFDSRYTARDGIERNTRFNGRFVSNLLVGKEYKLGRNDKNLLSLNTRIIYAGGRRTTPIDLEASQAKGEAVYFWERRYQSHLPHYFRMGARIAYTWNKPKISSTLSLDIQNLSNLINMFDRHYDEELQKLVYSNQLGILPVINYRVEF